jgi:cytochrome c oxidase subunit 4
MSDAHAHGHDKPDHIPHVQALSVYLKTFATLLTLTIVTVAVSYVNLGTTVNLIIAIAIATIKATVVAAFFMHLLHDNKFHTVIFLSGLVFLTVFVTFTMFDTNWRGQAEPIEHERPKNSMDPWATAAPSAAPGAPAAAPAAH